MSSELVGLVAGLAALAVGGDLLVRGASGLASRLGISPLVVGLTVVAFGTSAPELAVSVLSALRGSGDVAVGNVVGSNIFNVLVVLGASALAAPLIVASQFVRVEVPLMIAASLAVPFLCLDGRLGGTEGLLLFGVGVAYTWLTIARSRRESARDDAQAPLPHGSAPLDGARVVVGIALLVLGARWLVAAAVVMARSLGVGELLIGLTIVAAGTSLPEASASIVATLRGERDIAVGNAVGSNVFNILVVLGLTAIVAPDGLAVSPEAMRFDIPVMVAVAFACLPIFASGGVIDRWEGLLFLGYYVAYVAYLVIGATHRPSLPVFSSVMLAFVLPPTLLTIGLMTYRWRREHVVATD